MSTEVRMQKSRARSPVQLRLPHAERFKPKTSVPYTSMITDVDSSEHSSPVTQASYSSVGSKASETNSALTAPRAFAPQRGYHFQALAHTSFQSENRRGMCEMHSEYTGCSQAFCA